MTTTPPVPEEEAPKEAVPVTEARRRSVSDDERQLSYAMKALEAIYQPPAATTRKPKKKKPAVKKRKKTKRVVVDEKTGKTKEIDVEVDDFVYEWVPCICGMSHPPIPDLDPPKGKRCFYYWQIAEKFPYMTLYRVLATEMAFKKADVDSSGTIEMTELKKLLKGAFGPLFTDKMVERTFKEIDTDGSGSLDFAEVLFIVDTLVQRRTNALPEKLQREYSKVCSIQ